MRHLAIILLLALTTTTAHAVDDIIVDGVVYQWSAQDLAYLATGWDENTCIQSLHILAQVGDYDVVGIAPSAFEDNDEIVYVKIDEGITSIGQNAFCRCINMETIVMPEGLETIEEEAFAFCGKLSTVVIPSTVREIQSHAFTACTGVTDVYFLSTNVGDLDDFEWWDGVYRAAPQTAGGLEFNTNEHTTIHVPEGMLNDYINCGKFEAWLGRAVEDDDVYPLWWIVNYGVIGRSYTVSDALTAVYVDVNGDLYAKDDNHYLMPDSVSDDEVDFMSTAGLMEGRNYDQSNWVVLSGVAAFRDMVGYAINGMSITGVLNDKVNPVMTVTSSPVKGSPLAYTPNKYIAAALMGRTQQVSDGTVFAFVRPKPQEFAQIDWNIFQGNNEFYLPTPDSNGGLNRWGLVGGFVFNDRLLESGPVSDLQVGGYYPFSGILRYKTDDTTSGIARRRINAFAPYVESELTTLYDVFPVDLHDSSIPTGVDDVDIDDDAVEYVNLQGLRGKVPFDGLNFVISSRKCSTKKIIFK